MSITVIDRFVIIFANVRTQTGGGQPGCCQMDQPWQIRKRFLEVNHYKMTYLPRPEPTYGSFQGPDRKKDFATDHAQWTKEVGEWGNLRCANSVGYFCRTHGRWVHCDEVRARWASKFGASKQRCPPSHESWTEIIAKYDQERQEELMYLARTNKGHCTHDSGIVPPTFDLASPASEDSGYGSTIYEPIYELASPDPEEFETELLPDLPSLDPHDSLDRSGQSHKSSRRSHSCKTKSSKSHRKDREHSKDVEVARDYLNEHNSDTYNPSDVYCLQDTYNTTDRYNPPETYSTSATYNSQDTRNSTDRYDPTETDNHLDLEEDSELFQHESFQHEAYQDQKTSKQQKKVKGRPNPVKRNAKH
jgi:hypothetical protein